jgi:ABC-type phosphate transport system substrate-binding protein
LPDNTRVNDVHPRRAPAARRTLAASLALVLTGAASAPGGDAPGGTSATFKVIVNVKVAGASVPKQTLADIYLGRVRRWKDGRVIVPVDQPSNSPLRAAFTAGILGMTLPGVRAHWMRKLAAGERPPLARTGDAEVVRFVASQPTAIGYVAPDTPLPDTVKALAVDAVTDADAAPGAPDPRSR